MSAFSWARPGVEVVCVWQGAWMGTTNVTRHLVSATEYGVTTPEYGRVYTIRDVQTVDHRIGLRFVEIDNSGRGAREVSFLANHFRPLVRKSQSEDIALFKRIASDQPVEGV